MKFGEYLREARQKKGMTLADVAGKMDLSTVYISDIERGQRNPPDDEKIELLSRIVDDESPCLQNLADLHRGFVKIKIMDVHSERDKVALRISRLWPRAPIGIIRKIDELIG